MKNSGVTFLEKYAKFNVSKLTKITFILPLIVVLIAIAVIVGVGETTGNYTSAIGIGIDFQGGTMLTVNGLEDNEELQATIDSVPLSERLRQRQRDQRPQQRHHRGGGRAVLSRRRGAGRLHHL